MCHVYWLLRQKQKNGSISHLFLYLKRTFKYNLRESHVSWDGDRCHGVRRGCRRPRRVTLGHRSPQRRRSVCGSALLNYTGKLFHSFYWIFGAVWQWSSRGRKTANSTMEWLQGEEWYHRVNACIMKRITVHISGAFPCSSLLYSVLVHFLLSFNATICLTVRLWGRKK